MSGRLRLTTPQAAAILRSGRNVLGEGRHRKPQLNLPDGDGDVQKPKPVSAGHGATQGQERPEGP
jgi:hypothetical protein